MSHARVQLYGKYGNGKYMLVDTEDLPLVSGIRWHVSDSGYAVNRTQKKTIRAHRVIMKTPDGMDTDHINHDKLDNRKQNLRVCTRSENLQNSSSFRGYYYSRSRKCWIIDSKRAGTRYKRFSTEIEAAKYIKELGRQNEKQTLQ